MKNYGRKVRASRFGIPGIVLNLDNRTIVHRNVVRANSEGPNQNCEYVAKLEVPNWNCKLVGDIIFE